MILRRILQVALAIVVAAFSLSLATAAGAVDNPDYTAPPPTVPVTEPATVLAKQATPAVAAPSNQRLAITGSETTQLAVLGAVLLVGGAGLMTVRRRAAA